MGNLPNWTPTYKFFCCHSCCCLDPTNVMSELTVPFRIPSPWFAGWWRNQYEETPSTKRKRQRNAAFLSYFLAETLGTVTCSCFAPANPNQRGDSTACEPKLPLNSNLSHWVVSLIALLWMLLLLSDCKSPCHLGYHVKHFWWCVQSVCS